MTAWRKQLLFYSIIAMLAGLFCSRVLLSISMMLFVTVAFFHKDIRSHLRQFFRSPLLWSMSLLFILPLLSGLWSDDKKEWLDILQVKLPLLALPLAFAGPFTFSKQQWHSIAYFFIGLVAAGTLVSVSRYISNMDAVNQSYLKAKTMITPLGNDHVRFSWLVSITVLLSGWMIWKTRQQNRVVAIVLGLISSWLIIYLHLLVARTGLFSLYIILFITGGWLIFKKIKPVLGMVFLLSLLLLPFVAWYLFPSFQNRVKYFMYDYRYAREVHYLQGGNDAVRVISLRSGWNVLSQHEWIGVGAGDIPVEIRKWDQQTYPGILEADILYPSNEWLIYGLIAGWPGVLIFTGILLVPFFSRKRNRLMWWLLNSTVAGSFLFDIGLEVQFGVFIYAFIVLWWWKWLE
jgi:O-antigen ligase